MKYNFKRQKFLGKQHICNWSPSWHSVYGRTLDVSVVNILVLKGGEHFLIAEIWSNFNKCDKELWTGLTTPNTLLHKLRDLLLNYNNNNNNNNSNNNNYYYYKYYNLFVQIFFTFYFLRVFVVVISYFMYFFVRFYAVLVASLWLLDQYINNTE
jgi:hypothetical protein